MQQVEGQIESVPIPIQIYNRWLDTFPKRIWEQQRNGKWSSRPLTKEDVKDRVAFAKRMTRATIKRLREAGVDI